MDIVLLDCGTALIIISGNWPKWVAGNSNEAVETYSGEIGAKDYKQRPRMLQGAKILHDKIQGKAGKMILWAPHAYQYGYLQSRAPKPWMPGMPGGKVTQEQAEIIQQVSWNVYNNWKKTE